MADKKAVLVVGSGVSRAVSQGAERVAPTWIELLHDGLERCLTLGFPKKCEFAYRRPVPMGAYGSGLGLRVVLDRGVFKSGEKG